MILHSLSLPYKVLREGPVLPFAALIPSNSCLDQCSQGRTEGMNRGGQTEEGDEGSGSEEREEERSRTMQRRMMNRGWRNRIQRMEDDVTGTDEGLREHKCE